MAFVRLPLLLFLPLIYTVTTVSGFSDELKSVGTVPFQERFIEVFEDVHDRGRYYASPLAILDVNSTLCENNILTGKIQLVFNVILWSTEAKNEVYDYINTYVNSSVSYERLGMITMAKLRLKWKRSSRPRTEMFRFVDEWYSAKGIPNRSEFLIECNSLENCSRLQAAMKSRTALLNGLELEYTSGRAAKVNRIPLTGNHLLSTNLGRRLLQLRPWPASTQYRYLRSEDVTNLIDQTINVWSSALPQGSSYIYANDRAQLEAQLTAFLKKTELSSLLFPDSAWESVLWTPTFSRPDKLACYLNSLITTDNNPQYFQLDSGRRSASEEGVQMLNSSFFGVTVIIASATARSDDIEISGGGHLAKIDKQAFLERLRHRFTDLGFNGIRFMTKPIKLYRLDLNDLQSRKLLSQLDYVNVPEAAIHGIPIRVVASSKLTTEFGYQAEIMNLTVVFNNLDSRLTASVTSQKQRHDNLTAAVTNDLAAQNRRLSRTVEILKNATGVAFTRWGRTVCPAGSLMVYTGYVVTTNYKEYGGMGMYMCLTDSPTYYTDGRPTRGYTKIYRTKFNDNNGFLTSNAGTSIGGQDLVCTTCRRSGRWTSVIVWGSKECPTGWYKEYDGTIYSIWPVSSASGNAKLSTNAICVDGAPEVAPGGQAGVDKSYGYTLKTGCDDAMPCPPYIKNKSLTCAVCSK